MSKLTLDLNGLNVESFSAEDTAGATGMTRDMTCGLDAVAPVTWTDRVCCEAGVEACTVKEPCCVVTP